MLSGVTAVGGGKVSAPHREPLSHRAVPRRVRGPSLTATMSTSHVNASCPQEAGGHLRGGGRRPLPRADVQRAGG